MTALLSLILPDEAATGRLAEDLALALKAGDCIALSGDLGAGKSTLARALIRTIADDPDLEVPSPTFTLVQSYDLRIPVAHFDLYRIGDPDEVLELGLDEMAETGICLVEWPELAGDLLPKRHVRLRLDEAGDGRRASFSGDAAILARITRSRVIRAFLDAHGMGTASRRHLTGDASVRGYERIRVGLQPDMILMDAPRHMPGPIIQDGKYYQQLAHLAEDVRPFVAIDRDLRRRGFAAPEIHASDLDAGILLIEDLGSTGILDRDGAPIPERYLESARLLAHLHAQAVERVLPVGDGAPYIVPDFDRTAMTIETRLLIDWYLPSVRGHAATATERQDYFAIWDGLIDLVASGEKHLLLRDFHSPNILWRDDRTGLARIGLIDFQDAMIGPTAYDVASLAQDARVTIDPGLATEMLGAYGTERRRLGPFDEAMFLRDFHLMAAQRNCKLAGIWVRLKERDGKPGYMKHMPRTLAYLAHALSHPALAPLRDWCIKAQIL